MPKFKALIHVHPLEVRSTEYDDGPQAPTPKTKEFAETVLHVKGSELRSTVEDALAHFGDLAGGPVCGLMHNDEVPLDSNELWRKLLGKYRVTARTRLRGRVKDLWRRMREAVADEDDETRTMGTMRAWEMSLNEGAHMLFTKNMIDTMARVSSSGSGCPSPRLLVAAQPYCASFVFV